MKCELLPQDWYRVLQSVMRYSYIDREVIASFYDKRSKHYFKSSKDYRKFRQEHVSVIKKNQKEYGIPQGTALSGVLANIYMLDVDRKIQQIVQSNVMEPQVFGDARGTIFDVAVNIWHEINAV